MPQITVDEFIDVLLGNRKYIPCLYVLNKIDGISLEEVDRLAHQDNTVVISCEMGLKYGFSTVQYLRINDLIRFVVLCSLDYLVDRIWDVSFQALYINGFNYHFGNPDFYGVLWMDY